MICYTVSTVSVACNSPKSFNNVSALIYVTLVIDCILVFPFGLLIMSEIRYRGIWKKTSRSRSRPFLKNFWCWLDSIVYICLFASIILQAFEIKDSNSYSNDARSLVRLPRALTVLLVFRFGKFNRPSKHTIQIVKRAAKQIRNAAILFGYITFLFALVGIQLFGEINDHCVNDTIVDNTAEDNFSIRDYSLITPKVLAIPDTLCNANDNNSRGVINNYGYTLGFQPCRDNTSERQLRCPSGFSCKHFPTDKQNENLGDFSNLYSALLTVYDSSTQELWSFLMYDAIDFSDVAFVAPLYFLLLIIFVGWLAENVFVVVVIEAFADFRSKLFERYAPSAPEHIPSAVLQKHEGNTRGWTLVLREDQVKLDNRLKRFLASKAYKWIVVVLVLLEAVLMACRVTSDSPGLRDEVLLPIQISFTVIFVIEMALKIWSFGRKRYFSKHMTVFEFVTSVGSIANIIQWLIVGNNNPHYLALFQVMRIFRLIRASKTIEDFVYQILGDGKRLGILLIATLLFLFIFGIFSLQAFCHFQDVDQFATFPVAFMSTFQIIIQEGWVELTSEVMNKTPPYVAYTASVCFFLFVHLVGSLIIFSMFVAVIADNLELPEELKLQKQEQQSRIITEGEEELPWRLKVFELFPNNPKLVHIPNAPNYEVPAIRESVMRNFIDSGEMMRNEWRNQNIESLPQANTDVPLPRRDTHFYLFTSLTTQRQNLLRKRSSIASIIHESERSRCAPDKIEAISTVGGRRVVPPTATNRRLTASKIDADQTSWRKTLRRSKHKTVTDHVQKDLSRSKSGEVEGALNVDQTLHFRMRRSQEEAMRKRETKEDELRGNHSFFDSSLFLFGSNNRFRSFCKRIVDAKYEYKQDTEAVESLRSHPLKLNSSFLESAKEFASRLTYLDWISVNIAMITSILMCFETPKHRASPDCLFLYVSDFVFVTVTGLELLLKIVAHGLVFAPKAFIKDLGNVFDIFIFVVSLLYLIILPNPDPAGETDAVKSLLALRCLRPLRVISLSPTIRKTISEMFIVNTVSTSQKSQYGLDILYVTVLLIGFIFMWASYGLQLYSGKLKHCNDVLIANETDCVGYFEMPISVKSWLIFKDNSSDYPTMLVPRVWSNPRNFHFDNIGTAFLTLFEVITLEGWLQVRNVLNERLGWGTQLFLFSYIFLGILVVLTLFVGVILINFQKNKGTALLTVDQRRWRDLKKRLQLLQPLTMPPRPDNSQWRAWLYDQLQTRVYKWTSVLMIFLQSLTLLFPWRSFGVSGNDGKRTSDSQEGLMIAGVVFIVYFILEIILKIIALSVRGFFLSKRNLYELFITVVGFAYFISAMVSLSTNDWTVTRPLGITAIIMRTVMLVGKIEALKMLMLTLVVTVARSFYVFAALTIMLISYALIGVVLFHNVSWGQAIDRYANFQSSVHALLLMFRIVTGEDWNQIMHDCMVQPPECEGHNCGNVGAAVIFFCSFYVLVSFIVLNVLIAVMIENFSLFYSSEEDALLSHHDLKGFLANWNVIDRERKGAIPARHVEFLLRILDGRLKIDMDNDKSKFQHISREIEKFHGDEKLVGFQKVISVLAFWSVDIKDCLTFDEYWVRKELEDMIRYEVAQKTIQSWLERSFRAINENEAAAQSRQSPAISLNPIKQPQMQHYGCDEIEISEFTDTLRAAGGENSDSSGEENDECHGRSRLLSTDTGQSIAPLSAPVKAHARVSDQRGDSTRSDDSMKSRRIGRPRSLGDSTLMNTGRQISIQSDDMAPLIQLGTKAVTDEICDWFNEQFENESDNSDF